MRASGFAVFMFLCSTVFAACQSYSDFPPKTGSTGMPGSLGTVPSQGEIEICNTYAQDQIVTGTPEVPRSAGVDPIGAQRDTVDRGSDAGIAAGVGETLGATLHGLNEHHRNTPGYEAAYRSCMFKRGYK
jgi:hypothetical protein